MRNSICWRLLETIIVKRMNPIPKINIMQILVYERFILVVFGRLFWVLLLYFVSLGGINIISIKVFAVLVSHAAYA